jgi:hypothetical protein
MQQGLQMNLQAVGLDTCRQHCQGLLNRDVQHGAAASALAATEPAGSSALSLLLLLLLLLRA